jgi:hypothetical protein
VVVRSSARSLLIPLLSALVFTSFAKECVAPETPPEPSLADRGPLARAYLKKRLAVWQQQLQLQDWKISLLTSPSSDLRPGTLGNISWNLDKKTARIRILDVSEYRTSFQNALRDMEFSVVHELIHLDLASLPRTDSSRPDEEHAVNRIANALLRLEAPNTLLSPLTPSDRMPLERDVRTASVNGAVKVVPN